MTKIFKYPLSLASEQTLILPAGSRVIHVDKQFDKLMAWAEVTDSLDDELLPLSIVATGSEVFMRVGFEPEYMRTLMLDGGNIVVHIYRGVKKS